MANWSMIFIFNSVGFVPRFYVPSPVAFEVRYFSDIELARTSRCCYCSTSVPTFPHSLLRIEAFCEFGCLADTLYLVFIVGARATYCQDDDHELSNFVSKRFSA